MGDVDNRRALVPESPHRLVKALALVGTEGRRGLVHDEDAMVGLKRPHDLEHLLVCHREVACAGTGRDVDPKTVAELPEASFHGAALDHGASPHGAAEEDVRRRRHVRYDREFLVNGGDAGALLGTRAVLLDRFAENLDGARVCGVGAGEDLDECRLAGAVLADEAVDLALVEHEVDVLQRLDARKRLRDPLDADGVKVGGRCHGRVDPCLHSSSRHDRACPGRGRAAGAGRTTQPPKHDALSTWVRSSCRRFPG